MRLKIDENLPHGLAAVLTSIGHEADTVFDEALTGTGDDDLWPIVQKEQRVLVTRDLDFSDLRIFRLGTHFGIVVVRCGDVRRNALIARLREVFQQFIQDDWHGCHIVVGDKSVRVRRPE